MPPADIAAAARRVAVWSRTGEPYLLPDDLVAILPVLDAVTAGVDDTGRVERMARVLCRVAGCDPDQRANASGRHPGVFVSDPLEWELFAPQARAAIAFADAEAAVDRSQERVDGPYQTTVTGGYINGILLSQGTLVPVRYERPRTGVVFADGRCVDWGREMTDDELAKRQ